MLASLVGKSSELLITWLISASCALVVNFCKGSPASSSLTSFCILDITWQLLLLYFRVWTLQSGFSFVHVGNMLKLWSDVMLETHKC